MNDPSDILYDAIWFVAAIIGLPIIAISILAVAILIIPATLVAEAVLYVVHRVNQARKSVASGAFERARPVNSDLVPFAENTDTSGEAAEGSALL